MDVANGGFFVEGEGREGPKDIWQADYLILQMNCHGVIDFHG